MPLQLTMAAEAFGAKLTSVQKPPTCAACTESSCCGPPCRIPASRIQPENPGSQVANGAVDRGGAVADVAGNTALGAGSQNPSAAREPVASAPEPGFLWRLVQIGKLRDWTNSAYGLKTPEAAPLGPADVFLPPLAKSPAASGLARRSTSS